MISLSVLVLSLVAKHSYYFQMLMAYQYREETLQLIGKYLDRGPYAVKKFIHVGLIVYIHKLIQNPLKEFKYIMVLIWAKVLATGRLVNYRNVTI